jgi:hypothetical protein
MAPLLLFVLVSHKRFPKPVLSTTLRMFNFPLGSIEMHSITYQLCITKPNTVNSVCKISTQFEDANSTQIPEHRLKFISFNHKYCPRYSLKMFVLLCEHIYAFQFFVSRGVVGPTPRLRLINSIVLYLYHQNIGEISKKNA